MGTVFAVDLMVKTPSPFLLFIRAATAWIRSGRKRAATVLAGRGVLRLCLQRLRLLATPQVVGLAPLVPRRSSTSSLLSSGHVIRRPCRTGGHGWRLLGIRLYFVCGDARRQYQLSQHG